MATGNFNSANFNSANFRTDAAAATPIGNFDWANFDSPNWRVDTSRRYKKDSDSGISFETAYVEQGLIEIDDVALPHVLTITVAEPVALETRPINAGVPVRNYHGKNGRAATITGWTDSLATLNQIFAYADGAKHFLLLPTGDSFYAYISKVPAPRSADAVNYYAYSIEAQEAVD